MVVLVFLAVFVGVVLVHEFGHYIFAKLFGVQVLEFAIGFGPAVYRKKGKETDFRVNVFPLGGYVRLAGENPYEGGNWEEGKGFYDKPAWQRFFISFAGPAFSILAGYALFLVIVNIWGVSFSGVSQVIPNSPAEKAGLEKGDIILKMNGNYVFDHRVISDIIKEGRKVNITVLRGGKKVSLSVSPQRMPYQLDLFLSSATGNVLGNFVSIENNNQPDPNFLKTILKNRVEVDFEGSRLEGILDSYFYVPSRYALGFVFSGLSPVLKRDYYPLKKGDRIMDVNGMRINGWLDFIRVSRYVSMDPDQVYVELVGKAVDWWSYGAPESLVLSVMRNGRKLARIRMDKNELAKMFTDSTLFEIETPPYKPRSFSERLDIAVSRCNWILVITWNTLFKGFFRSVSSGEVAGPVGLAWAVGTAAKMGLDSVLVLVAVITINLGIFNLLPLPALDGGRIVFALIEMITRKRVDPRIEAMVHAIGFLLLMGFLIYITFMDIGRFAW